MGTIVLDSQSVDLFRNFTGGAVLGDDQGNIVGYFEPPVRLYQPGEIPKFDEAELKRRVQRWEGIPSAEVRRQLEQKR